MFAKGYFPFPLSGSGVDEEVLDQMQADIDAQQALWDIVPLAYKNPNGLAWGRLVDITVLNNAISISEDGWAENLANTNTKLTTLQSLVQNNHSTQLTDLYTRTSNNTTSLTALTTQLTTLQSLVQNNHATQLTDLYTHTSNNTTSLTALTTRVTSAENNTRNLVASAPRIEDQDDPAMNDFLRDKPRVVFPFQLPLAVTPYLEFCAAHNRMMFQIDPVWGTIDNVLQWYPIQAGSGSNNMFVRPIPALGASLQSPYLSGDSAQPARLVKSTEHYFHLPNEPWPVKGAVVLVHSFPDTVPLLTTYTLMSSRAQTTTRPMPNFIWNHDKFVVYSATGATDIYNIPNGTDTLELNRPYAVGLSWDFSVNPFKLTLMSPFSITHYPGVNTPMTLRTSYRLPGATAPFSETRGAIVVPAGVWHNPVYRANCGTVNNSEHARLTFYGRLNEISQMGGAVNCHYIGLWKDTFLNADDMLVVRERLRERYEMVSVWNINPSNARGVNTPLPTITP